MSEIVKCKWCGSPAEHKEELIHGAISHVIRCTNPKCGCSLGRRTKEGVHLHWNKHHSDKRPAGVKQHPML